ncbi:four helix bundle protein [Patescibacteria group bacterium]|nr:four helix bundle protein [Patescibacteria group bacterium]
MDKAYKTFEDLRIWQEARQLVTFVYSSTKSVIDRDFRSQMRRASLSVMNNIAEGHESHSTKTMANYLLIAKGSCGEVRSLFYAGFDLGYFSQDTFTKGLDDSRKLSRMIASYSKIFKH